MLEFGALGIVTSLARHGRAVARDKSDQEYLGS